MDRWTLLACSVVILGCAEGAAPSNTDIPVDSLRTGDASLDSRGSHDAADAASPTLDGVTAEALPDGTTGSDASGEDAPADTTPADTTPTPTVCKLPVGRRHGRQLVPEHPW